MVFGVVSVAAVERVRAVVAEEEVLVGAADEGIVTIATL